MTRILLFCVALALSASIPAHGESIIAVQPSGSSPPPVDVPVIFPSRAVGRTHDCSSYYPAAETRETGDILVSYDVGLKGEISNVALVKASGNAALDNAALTCVREKWRNTPALQDDTPVASPGHQALIQFYVR